MQLGDVITAIDDTEITSLEGLPPRKYYELTEAGREYLGAMRRDWSELNAAMKEMEDEENE